MEADKRFDKERALEAEAAVDVEMVKRTEDQAKRRAGVRQNEETFAMRVVTK